jgi:FMN phosphatase YigB (HAD superfamily)
MKTKILIDFDGTILNTSELKNKLFPVFEKAGFSHDEVMDAYRAECLHYHFSIDGMIKRLKEVKDFNISLTNARIENAFNTIPKLIFDDFHDFISKIDRSKYEIDLFTLGNLNFQRTKVEHSGLVLQFDHIYYTDIQKWEYLDKIVEKDERFVFIDDRSDTVHEVSQKFPHALALYINRKAKDKDDPVIVKSKYKNLEIANFHQALLNINN